MPDDLRVDITSDFDPKGSRKAIDEIVKIGDSAEEAAEKTEKLTEKTAELGDKLKDASTGTRELTDEMQETGSATKDTSQDVNTAATAVGALAFHSKDAVRNLKAMRYSLGNIPGLGAVIRFVSHPVVALGLSLGYVAVKAKELHRDIQALLAPRGDWVKPMGELGDISKLSGVMSSITEQATNSLTQIRDGLDEVLDRLKMVEEAGGKTNKLNVKAIDVAIKQTREEKAVAEAGLLKLDSVEELARKTEDLRHKTNAAQREFENLAEKVVQGPRTKFVAGEQGSVSIVADQEEFAKTIAARDAAQKRFMGLRAESAAASNDLMAITGGTPYAAWKKARLQTYGGARDAAAGQIESLQNQRRKIVGQENLKAEQWVFEMTGAPAELAGVDDNAKPRFGPRWTRAQMVHEAYGAHQRIGNFSEQAEGQYQQWTQAIEAGENDRADNLLRVLNKIADAIESEKQRVNRLEQRIAVWKNTRDIE